MYLHCLLCKVLQLCRTFPENENIIAIFCKSFITFFVLVFGNLRKKNLALRKNPHESIKSFLENCSTWRLTRDAADFHIVLTNYMFDWFVRQRTKTTSTEWMKRTFFFLEKKIRLTSTIPILCCVTKAKPNECFRHSHSWFPRVFLLQMCQLSFKYIWSYFSHISFLLKHFHHCSLPFAPLLRLLPLSSNLSSFFFAYLTSLFVISISRLWFR